MLTSTQAVDAANELMAMDEANAVAAKVMRGPYVRMDLDRGPRATIVTLTTYINGECVDIRCAGELWSLS